MLHPRDRTVLLEALRPPDGYALHSAVGTTYSLDLMALLAAPVAGWLSDRFSKRNVMLGSAVAQLLILCVLALRAVKRRSLTSPEGVLQVLPGPGGSMGQVRYPPSDVVLKASRTCAVAGSSIPALTTPL